MGEHRQGPKAGGVSGGVNRAVEVLRPLALKGLAFARTLPGHCRDLVERADVPRRLRQGRDWLEEKDLPARTRKLADAAAQTGLIGIVLAKRGAAAVAARLGPAAVAASATLGMAVKSFVAVLSRRTVAISAALNERRAAIAAVAERKVARKMAAKSTDPIEPVPSELMRLLKEEGVEVEGVDVREALPEPVRPMPVQGILPLFADEASPSPGKRQ